MTVGAAGLSANIQLYTTLGFDLLQPDIPFPFQCSLQGSLPMLNQEAVNLAIRAGIALNANIARRSKFDRKQYFYADLPKGYQIRCAHREYSFFHSQRCCAASRCMGNAVFSI
jgi:hypothetical protein